MRSLLFRITLWLLMVSVIFVSCSCEQLAKVIQQAAESQSQTAEAKYEVLKVPDGDTVQLLDTQTGEKVKLRLFGVDAPEKKQSYGLQAQQCLSEQITGKKVNVRSRAKDQYGRLVGEILLADGTNVNENLLKSGCVWHYKQYSKDPNWASMEDAARSAKVGLWAGKRPTPPWDYRKRQREKKNKNSNPNEGINSFNPEEETDELIFTPLTN